MEKRYSVYRSGAEVVLVQPVQVSACVRQSSILICLSARQAAHSGGAALSTPYSR
jgi:hypothetical protein